MLVKITTVTVPVEV